MLSLGPPLAVTLAPLVARFDSSVQRAVEHIGKTGARAVQLSAAQKDLRPRDLGSRDRKDVLGLLARNGLMLAGLDLMIPHKEYLHSATQDRAVSAAIGAVELAADLGRVPLSLALPVEKLPDEVAGAILAAADGRGVTLAIHAEHDLDGLDAWLNRHDIPLLRVGLDPAALLALGHDPAAVVIRFAPRLAVTRLDDHATTSVASAGGRRPVGEGELDVLIYRAALATAEKLRHIVLELRDLPDPFAALAAGLTRWERAGAIR